MKFIHENYPRIIEGYKKKGLSKEKAEAEAMKKLKGKDAYEWVSFFYMFDAMYKHA